MADGAGGDERFRPQRVGFAPDGADVRRVEAFRSAHRRVSFGSACRREVVCRTLEVLAHGFPRGGTVDIELAGRVTLATRDAVGAVLGEIYAALYGRLGLRGNLFAFSELSAVDPELWDLVYDRPRVRLGWLARELASCGDDAALEEIAAGSTAFQGLRTIAEGGLWPHIVLPATRTNVRLLPEMVPALLEVTRGASIDIVPAPFVPSMPGAEAPAPDDYTEAVLALYRNRAVPLRLVSPLSWVAARMNSQVPLVRSAASAGAEIAVTPNGDLYVGEFGVGIERWRIGNVLQASGSVLTFSTGTERKMAERGAGLTPTLHWERLDAAPESFSNAMQPERCQTCDWRYRCGGLDASVFQLEERRRLAAERGSVGTAAAALERIEAWPEGETAGDDGDWPDLAELYCAPRKALFEEMLWDCAESAAQRQAAKPRERLELSDEGIAYVPVAGEAEG